MTTAFAAGSLSRTFIRRGPVSIRIAAWGVWVAIVATVLGGIAVWASEGFSSLPLDFGSGPANVLAVGLIAATSGTVGALLAWRHPRNPIGWLLLLDGFTTSLATPVNLLVSHGLHAYQSWPTTTILPAWLMSAFHAPSAVAVAVLIVLLFPDGRFAGPRWRVAAVVTLAGAGLLAVASACDPAGMLWYPALPNPTSVGADQAGLIGAVRAAGAALTVVALAMAAASVAARYRRTERRERLQLRWVVGGAAVMGATFVPFLVGRYVLDITDGTSDVLLLLMTVGAAGFPLTVAVAMVHEQLYEIDALIWRSLVYIPLMGLLAGTYAASVAFFQRLFISVTGNSSDGAIVISSLMLAAMFSPAKSAIEARVSRRLKPPEAHAHGHDDAGEPMPAQHRSAAPAEPAHADGSDVTPDRATVDESTIRALEERVAALERALTLA